jgi:hypothetical protein
MLIKQTLNISYDTFLFISNILFPYSEPDRFVTVHQDQRLKDKNYKKITSLQPQKLW